MTAKRTLMAGACFIVASGLFAGATGAKAEPLILEPTSKWATRSYADKCRLSRNFGEGENKTSLRIDQGGVEPYYTIAMVGRPVRSPYGRVIGLQFGPSEQETRRGYITAKSASGKPALIMYGVMLAPVTALQADAGAVGSIGDERKARVEWLSLSRAVIKPFRFNLGAMRQPLADLQDCAKLLAVRLEAGSVGGAGKSRAARPEGNPGKWVTPSDYPRDLLRQGMDGRVMFRLTISAKGKPTACHITSSNRPQMFDDAVCLSLMKRSSFRPALDEEGNPRPSYWSSAVRFEIL